MPGKGENTSRGVVGSTYTLENEPDPEPIDLEPFFDDVSDAPDYDVSERRKALVHYTRQGATPDLVAQVLGLADWRSDDTLRMMVERAEAAFLCEMQIKFANECRNGGKVSAGVKLMMEYRVGMKSKGKGDTDDDDEGKPPVVHVIRKVVDGRKHREDPKPEPVSA